jgi:non-heme chloroperoxidase
MERLSARVSAMLALLLAAALYSQRLVWKEPSAHNVKFVQVADGVRLEVLDWGGSGRSVVLLSGGGDTAHVFDDFAPKLTASFHVYGVTRRGFGESEFAALQANNDLGKDVLAVLDWLKLDRPVLVGHSFAGEEMSSIAEGHPNRLAGLVYLEAAYPYAFDNGKGPKMEQFLALHGPQPPPPNASDLASFNSLQQYYLRVLGFTYPEAELRQQWDSSPDGRVGNHRDFPGYSLLESAVKNYKKCTAIPVPALAIFAIPHSQGKWVDNNPDPKIREAATAYSAALTPLTERQAIAFENGVPTARVIRVPGAHHYIYLSNEADVLREIRSFLVSLR